MERRNALAFATATLTAAGCSSPRVDAELLLAFVLQVPRGRLALVEQIPDDVHAAYEDCIARRAAGEPLQHITGLAHFRRVDLAVGPGVFVPRPETELIVDLAASSLATAKTVVDLCSGSGAIALAVADEYPRAWVIAVERSPEALTWLRRNTSGSRIEVVEADVADADLLATLDGKVDVVLSNPPYVPSGSRPDLAPDVAHDPQDALFAGEDGLELMPALFATAARLLRPGGFFAVEHDDSHGDAVPALLASSGWWDDIADHHDLTGRPRFSTARRLGQD